jgi:hypothetical protein
MQKKEEGEATENTIGAWRSSLFSPKTLLISIVFGVLALAVVLGGLHIPIPGTGVVTDPRELFTTIGSSLSGPVGGVLIGILAGIAEPGGIALASLLGHIAGCLFLGLAYKKLVYERLKVPLLYLGWFGLIFVYYFVLVVPGFAVGIAAFYPEAYAESFGEMSVYQAYLALAQGAMWETLLTASITTLAMIAMPKRHRQPLW